MTKAGTASQRNMRQKLFDPVPNPTTGPVTVKFTLTAIGGSQSAVFTLMDSRGIRVMEIPVSLNQDRISFSADGLSPGVYFYRISGNFGSTEVKKLIVIH